jgi:hypothetical protein
VIFSCRCANPGAPKKPRQIQPEAERRYLHKRVAQERVEIQRLRREASRAAETSTFMAAHALKSRPSGGGASSLNRCMIRNENERFITEGMIWQA